MGWNKGYTIIENTIISIHNAGALTPELLNNLMQPFCGSDIDHGGCYDLRTNDNLSADEVVCKVMEPERFALILPIPNNKPERILEVGGKYVMTDNSEHEGYKYDTWQEALQDERNCKVYDLWREITKNNWKFW